MVMKAFIGRREPDDTITGIYCHNDGYVEYVGEVLNKYYTDRNKVNQLIELGGISCLGREIGKKIDFNKDYSSYAHIQCIAYHRDRNEHLKICTNGNITEICACYLYVYIYENDDTWSVYYDKGYGQPLCNALNNISKHKYLILFNDNDYELCKAKSVHEVILQMADYTGCRTELFENALSGMKTDKQQIELFNKFSTTTIQHIFVVSEEIGAENTTANDTIFYHIKLANYDEDGCPVIVEEFAITTRRELPTDELAEFCTKIAEKNGISYESIFSSKLINKKDVEDFEFNVYAYE